MIGRVVASLRPLAIPLAIGLPLLTLALALFLPEHLPFVDFPQHVALVSVWTHLDDPTRGLADRYTVDLATPYATGYLVARVLALFLGDEGSIRTLMFLSLAGIPLATLAVMRAYGRPPELALAAFAVAFSWVTFMGFVEFIAALPLVIGSVALVAGIGRARWPGPCLAVVALLAFATHAFALPMLAAVAIAAALAADWRRRLPATIGALVPALVLGAIWAVGRSHTPSPDPMPFSIGSPIARLAVTRYLFGSDAGDPRVIGVTIGLLAIAIGAVLMVRREKRSDAKAPASPDRPDAVVKTRSPLVLARLTGRPLLLPAAAAALGYAVTPLTALDSYGLWQRFAPVAFALALGLVPWPSAHRSRAALTATLVVVACGSSLSTLAQSAEFDRQIAGLDAVVLQLPPGQRLYYRDPGVRPAGVGVAALRHLGAEYLALRGGDISYNFLMFPHLVLRDRRPRTLANESRIYDVELRLVGPCNVPQPPPTGPLLARAGNWQAFAVTVPLDPPPSRTFESLPAAPSC